MPDKNPERAKFSARVLGRGTEPDPRFTLANERTFLAGIRTALALLAGVYPGADGTPRGGKDTPVITRGHSKDHRPDLKQLLWILTVAAVASVPIAYRLADGNTNDDPTHVRIWDGLVSLLGRTDFLYVADSKLCTRDAMSHIHRHHGRFVTVLPRTRSEDGCFRSWAQTHTPSWTEASR